MDATHLVDQRLGEFVAEHFGLKVRRYVSEDGIGVAGSSLALIFAGPVVPRVLSAYGSNGWR